MGKPRTAVFPAEYRSIRAICAFLVEGAREAGFGGEDLFRIELACDEACTNIVQYAYGPDGEGQIAVSWQMDAESFTMTFRDRGRAFDPEKVPAPNVPADPAELEHLRIGGLGLHFMRQLMDTVRFDFDPEEGNSLVMVKKRPAGSPS